ncbi:small heat shock protein [Fragilaria crotonensis]|nr:small heat shock protein [Fragilaria crotonensis]
MAIFLVRYPQPEGPFMPPHVGHHRRFQHHGPCSGGRGAMARQFGHCSPNVAHRRNNPPANVNEDDNKVELSLDVPGIKAEDLTINVENNVLTISGQRAVATSDNYFRFSRRFALDTTVDTNNVTATLANGVLTISAPKIAKPGPITIAVSEVSTSTPPTTIEVPPTATTAEESQMSVEVPVKDTPSHNEDDDIVLVEATNEEESLEHDDEEA